MSRPVVCLGTGRMGRGIALAFALKGHPVVMLDVKERSASEQHQAQRLAHEDMAASLAALERAGGVTANEAEVVPSRIRFAVLRDAEAALADAVVVFECVPEVMQVKRSAFAAIAPVVPPDTILASTTSTFLSTDVASLVARPARFLNAHWLNPAFVIPLVEVSPHDGTDPAVTRRLVALLEGIGKVPVHCAPAPGYIVPRLQSLLMNEAARMIEQGVASAEDIDRAIRFGLGLRYASMGVVEFIDFGGNDILHYASAYLANALGDQRYASPSIIARHMAEKRNGLKDGKGFYDWSGRDIPAYRAALLSKLVAQVHLVDRDKDFADSAASQQSADPEP